MRIFELKFEDNFTRCKKYLSKLYVFHSFVRIFDENRKERLLFVLTLQSLF